jgi:membrane peptidoglycan carboxypeptidase
MLDNSKASRPLPEWVYTRGAVVAIVIVVLGILTTGYVAWTLRDMPDPGQDNVLAKSIVIYDRHGKEIEQRNAQGMYHVVLKLNEMGKYGPAATLASEDRDFYRHGAINWGSTARAAWVDLTQGGYVQGGSTITQQLVKIQLLTPQKSIFRKTQEAILAEALERRYSKDQILEMYLNRVYYGHGAYGLGAAAKAYFSKDAKDLTPAQAAFLAGLIQAPYYYDPQTHYDRAKSREDYVLKGLVQTGALTRDQADKAGQEDIKSQIKYDNSFRKSKAPLFVDYVVQKLEAQFGQAAIQQGGFAVYTTLDLDLQRKAEQAVADGVKDLSGMGVNNGDLVAADPRTGEILAWVGSADYYNQDIGGQFDVILSPRQPGSSFKVYDYEAALKDHKITLASIVHDRPTDFGGGYKPLDFDNRTMGDMDARKALVLSRNIPAVEVASKEGIDNVINLAHQLGINTQLQPVLATAIGGSEVTMFDHLQGYEVFANQGKKMPLMTITRIVDNQGNTVFEQKPGGQEGQSQPLSAAEAYLITDTLKDYQNQWGLGWNRQMASKSGTSGGNQIGVHPDAWMMAYNPNIVVGAWGGNTGPNGAGKPVSAFGVNVGSTILREFINSLPPNYRDWYQRPPGIVDGKGCPGQPDASHEIFLEGTKPDCTGSQPSPTPVTPSPQLPSPPPVPSPLPSPLPSVVPKPSPTPSPAPKASP